MFVVHFFQNARQTNQVCHAFRLRRTTNRPTPPLPLCASHPLPLRARPHLAPPDPLPLSFSLCAPGPIRPALPPPAALPPRRPFPPLLDATTPSLPLPSTSPLSSHLSSAGACGRAPPSGVGSLPSLRHSASSLRHSPDMLPSAPARSPHCRLPPLRMGMT
jgi:hypothetical protein